MAMAVRRYRASRMLASAKMVSGVEKERALRYGSIRSSPVLVAGMLTTAAMTRTADHRAREDSKQAVASVQQATIMPNSVITYQAKIVQSMERWVSRAVQARVGLKRDK